MANHPARLAHLFSVPLLAELLSPSYASVSSRDAIDVYDEVKAGLSSAGLHGPLCSAVWAELQAKCEGANDEELVERVAKALARGKGPRAREAGQPHLESMTALFAVIDVHIGRASDAARQALETPRGRQALSSALRAAAVHLIKCIKV